ncbi:MAG: IS66 family transposase [Myxococcales bacterium]|nr:IS66 family transposase [Myxococcales bacterium]
MTDEEADALRAENARLHARLAEMIDQLARLTDRVAELTAIVGRKARKGREPAPSTDLSSSTLPGDRPAPPPLPPVLDKEKAPIRPTGRQPLPEHLEVVSESHRPDVCRHCGAGDLRVIGEERVDKLDTVREHLRTRRIVRKTCRCNTCNKTTTAEMPPMPWAKSKVTSNVVAHVVHQKVGLHVPLDRMRRDFAVRGVPIAISTLVSLMFKAGDLLAAIDGEHWRELLAGTWLHTDGSGIDVVVEGHPGVVRGHIDVFTRDDVAVYTFALSKDGKDFAGKLAKFEGTLVADAERRLDATYASGRILEAGCNAHGIRKFEDALGEQPVLAAEAVQFLQAMFVEDAAAQERGLTGAARLAWRQERIAPICQTFRAWLDHVGPTLVPSSPLSKAIRYHTNHWEALTRFLGNPDIPMSNNASERLFRPLDTGRLNWLFASSPEAAHNLAVLMGLVATCRLKGVDPQAYLAWALDRRGTWRDKLSLPVSKLTPAAYKEALEQRDGGAG